MHVGEGRLTAAFIVDYFKILAALFVLYALGGVHALLAQNWMGIAICAVILWKFCGVLILCFRRARRLDAAFDDLKAGKGEQLKAYIEVAKRDPAQADTMLSVALNERLSTIEVEGERLPNWGLIGTIVGITYALTLGVAILTVPGIEDLFDHMDEFLLVILKNIPVAFLTTLVAYVCYDKYKGLHGKLTSASMKLIERVIGLGQDLPGFTDDTEST